MKKLIVLFLTSVASAQPLPPPAATPTEVNAGTVKNKYVSPFTLAGFSSTNAPAATNYSQNITYNGKITFNSNVVVTTLSFPTNAWPGATNTLLLNTNYLNYVAATDCAITNIGGQDATMNTWATLTVSNSTASDITVRTYSPGIRLQGAATTAALVIGAGKEGFLSFHCRGVLSTNLVTSTQQ